MKLTERSISDGMTKWYTSLATEQEVLGSSPGPINTFHSPLKNLTMVIVSGCLGSQIDPIIIISTYGRILGDPKKARSASARNETHHIKVHKDGRLGS